MGAYIYIIALIVWNSIVFFVYGLDKFLAKHNMWRISEKTLLTIAFLGGGVGAFCGMKSFHHKTKHKNFQTLLPIAGVITMGLFGVLINN